MSDYKRKVAGPKGNLTKIHTQFQNQESIRSDRRDQSTLNHLEDLRQRVEKSYATLSTEIEESFPGDESKQREEVGHYNDFVLSADKARQIINAMKSQRQAYVLMTFSRTTLPTGRSAAQSTSWHRFQRSMPRWQ